MNTFSFSLVDICPVGAFTADIDKFTTRLHHSSNIHSYDLLDWARTAIRLELNASLIKVTPLPLRNDRILQMNTSFPILSDFSRLVVFDLIDLLSQTSFIKHSLDETATHLLDHYKIHKFLMSLKTVVNSNVLPFHSYDFVIQLCNLYHSKSQGYNNAFTSLHATQDNLVQTYEDIPLVGSLSFNLLIEHSNCFFGDSVNYFKPLLNWFSQDLSYFLFYKKENTWSIGHVNNIFRFIKKAEQKERYSISTYEAFNLFSLSNKVVFYNYKISNLFCFSVIYPDYRIFFIKKLSFFYQINTLLKKATFLGNHIFCDNYLTSVRLPLISLIHTTRYPIG